MGGWGDVGLFDEVMAYPKIDLPMYQPLKAISVENFLPGMNYIAPNSITLVETNQRFIEAYMVGLNHEFARKLLWREYPTDQRGSYFRQFWDVHSYIDPIDGLSATPRPAEWRHLSRAATRRHGRRRRRRPGRLWAADRRPAPLAVWRIAARHVRRNLGETR